MAIKLLQDIHLSDMSTYNLFKEKWKTAHYRSGLEILDNARNNGLDRKFVDAEWFNALTTLLYEVENLSDPDFKNDKIIASTTAPPLQVGEVYFCLDS